MPIQVFTNNCRASLDVVVFYGVPPDKLHRDRDFELVVGTWAEFEQRPGRGRRRAEPSPAGVGSSWATSFRSET